MRVGGAIRRAWHAFLGCPAEDLTPDPDLRGGPSGYVRAICVQCGEKQLLETVEHRLSVLRLEALGVDDEAG